MTHPKIVDDPYTAAAAANALGRLVAGSGTATECTCPVGGGLIRHDRAICTDPVVIRLGWFYPEPASGGAGMAAAAIASHGAPGRNLFGPELGPALVNLGWSVACLAGTGRPLDSAPGVVIAAGLSAVAAAAALAQNPAALTGVSALSSALACVTTASTYEPPPGDDLAGALQALAAAARLAGGLLESDYSEELGDGEHMPALLALVATAAAELATAELNRAAAGIVSRETST